MAVFKPPLSTPTDQQEFAAAPPRVTQPLAEAYEPVEEMSPELAESLDVEHEPSEDSAEQESTTRAVPQTREAYLKKGEDLIRSLL